MFLPRSPDDVLQQLSSIDRRSFQVPHKIERWIVFHFNALRWRSPPVCVFAEVGPFDKTGKGFDLAEHTSTGILRVYNLLLVR
jgi:hypothetical protein